MVATWAPAPWPLRVRLAATAIARLTTLPRSAIVHVHLSERGSFLREGAILGIARQRGLCTVATLHGATLDTFARDHASTVSRVLRLSDGVICLSQVGEDVARRLAPDVPTWLIPNPVPIDGGSQPASSTSEIVLFVGEIGPRKGIDVLEAAWPLIAAERSGAQCIVAGPSTGFRLSPHERFRVDGEVSHAQVLSLLRESRVAVLPSRAEAMPMVLLEAQAAGRPFVATPVGAVAQLADHGGVLVEVGDVVGFARAVISLLEDPGLAATLGAQGQEFIAQTRTPALVDRELRAVYDSVTRAGHRSRPPSRNRRRKVL